MKKSLAIIAALALAFGLAACEQSEKTKEAVAFEKFCSVNQGAQECIDHKANNLGGGQ